MTIGELARRAGVGIETVRFYERQGLLAEPPRRESGYRDYSPETVVRLRFIRQAKDLGFSLTEIQELLSLRAGAEPAGGDVLRRVEAKVAEVRAKILALKRIERALGELAAACAVGGSTCACPILEALERQAEVAAR